MRISALFAVSTLALSGLAFGSSAFAADTATATPSAIPTISPMPGGGTLDAGLSDEDIQAIADDSASSVSDGQEADVVEPQEDDVEVDAINAEDSQEEADFADDVNAATQAGDSEDVVQLNAAAADVISVTAPVVQAMTADNAQAHTLIAGQP